MLAIGVLLSGCGRTLLNAEDEARIGAEQHPLILKEFGGTYDNPRIAAYVERVMARIAKASDKPQANYQIFVLDTPVVNAFALPGGYTYVTRGLLALADNEAELAGVIGHEIAHVTARHGARRHTANLGTQIVAGVLGAALKIGAGINPRATGDLVNLGGAALMAGYSRENEYEADNLGIQTMARAGYRPAAQADFLAKLGRYAAYHSGGKQKAGWFSTHPNNAERVAKAYEKAKARTTAQSTYVGRQAHMMAIDGMAFGDTPAAGVIRGQGFSHADLALQFRVPKGFKLRNTPQRVTAEHANGVQIIFDMDARIANEPALDYLRGGWANGARLSQARKETIGGRLAASGRVRTENAVALLLAIPHGTEQFLRFGIIAPMRVLSAAETAMASVKRQIRFLSAAEVEAIRPLRLRVVDVQPGDSVANLMRRMRGDDTRGALFRLINNVPDNDRLEPGRPVKLIVD